MADGKNSAAPAAIRNVEEIAQLEREGRAAISRAEQIGLRVIGAVGTIRCAILHLVALLLWAGWNVGAPAALRFDPYPFGLLTMVVSMEGLLVALLVLAAQNRLSVQTDRRDHLNLQVSLLAEQEMTMVLRMLDRISRRLGTPSDQQDQEEARELMERTNIYELMEELRRRL
jgi:uncharacterized membrane protein